MYNYIIIIVYYNILHFHALKQYSIIYILYLTLLSLHTITILPLTTVYVVSEVHCTSNVLHNITPAITYKCKGNFTHYYDYSTK